MNLEMMSDCVLGLKSGSQIARRISEGWGAANLYCIACVTDRVVATPPNTKAIDFRCGSCGAGYQLKCGRNWNETRVPDAAYGAMIDAIRSNATPNLILMQYTPSWSVKNLLLVPSFFLTESAIEKRKPLGPTARRAGWVGCNIVLRAIPADGKLRIVRDGILTDPADIRNQFRRVSELARLPPKARGWTLDVLRVVRDLKLDRFSLVDVYAKQDELSRLYPNNRHVRAKIRQQLQLLRDLHLICFEGRGQYSIVRI